MAMGDASRFYNRYVGPMTDQMEYLDPLGGRPISQPSDPQELIRQYIEEMQSGGVPREGITNEIDMGPDPYQGNEYSDEEYQVAGDVVPMRTHPPSISDVTQRLQTPGVGARSQGMQSIERFGKDPRMIDLMDVIMRMGGPR